MIAADERKVDVDVQLSPADALDASRWMFFAGSRYAMLSFLFLFGIFPVGYFLFTLRAGQPSWILLAYPAAMLLVVPGMYWGTKQSLMKGNPPGQAVRYSFSSFRRRDLLADLFQPVRLEQRRQRGGGDERLHAEHQGEPAPAHPLPLLLGARSTRRVP